MSFLKNRKTASVIAVIMIAAAVFIGFQHRPVSQTEDFYIADYAGVLSQSGKQSLLDSMYELNRTTGARFFVVTVDDTKPMNMEDYFVALAKQWDLGSRDIMLLLSIDGDDYYFDFGENWYSSLRGTYQAMLDKYLEPDFASRNYEKGITEFYAQASAAVSGSASLSPGTSYVPNTEYVQQGGSFVSTAVSMAVIIAVIIMVIVLSSIAPRRRYYPVGRRYRGFYYPPSYFPPVRHVRPPYNGGMGSFGGGMGGFGGSGHSGSSRPGGGGRSGGGRH